MSSKRPFRRSAETSSKMDVSPATGMQISDSNLSVSRKSFRADARTVSAESSRPCFRSRNTDEIVRVSERRSFRTGNNASLLRTNDIDTQDGKLKTPVNASPVYLAEEKSVPEASSTLLKSDAIVSQAIQSSDPQTDAVSSTAETSVKSKAASKTKDNSAAEIKDKILQKVTFIKHSGGLYAFNGRTYVAINDPSQLVGIVINQVDEKMFGLTTTNIFSSVLTMLKVDDKLIPHDYKERAIASENIVVFKNTLLDVCTLKKIPFDPWYITSYEIDANYVSHPEPDIYMDFLNTVSGGDQEIADCITDTISYLLSGSNRGKMFFVMGTAPDSGKSSLASFLQGVINEKYIFNVAPNEFKDRFALGGSRGHILNISMDLPSTKLHSDVVATIKKISGGDRIMQQEKNEKKEFGVSSLRLLFGSNHAIAVHPDDDNDAFWSRLQVIPFTQTIPPEDKEPHLVQKLLDERDDIVSYCIQRMPDIIERGYKLSPCQAAEDIKNEWRYGIPDAESLESFCDTFIEITGNQEDVVLATDIYSPYREYCKGIGVKPLREEKIKQWFDSHGGECKHKRLPGAKNAQSLIYGIRLLEDINH